MALVGAGLRGREYTKHATASGLARVVAVAEPDADRRSLIASTYDIAPSSVFTTWEDLAAAGRLADVAVVTTQDRMHADPAVALTGQVYHLLLEKPMAPTKARLGSAPASVASFGGLAHFRPEKRPAGAGERCVDCAAEPSCPYSAVRLYRRCLAEGSRWPLSAVTDERTDDALMLALREGPYGRCVYDCDNDVVDHQVVAMQYPGGKTATFTMTAFTPMQGRQTRMFGRHGSIEGDGRTLRVTDFRTGVSETVEAGGASGGHDGGDEALVHAFLGAVAHGDPSRLSSDMATSLASHRVVWAAERARLSGSVVTL
ncbi:Gfo/Idh/MocA family oxidoreductase [Actinoplanes sp. Pm04-4]|uniref:Gfo/Idh/MocA family oxidoreductase n=1 Tax=Paractinoplanes pyxinae TaxID=2997416 RepID=A0ABT4ASP2_9ACTN|nr:Gfo/Idh/MocA family oxidoreductase [Actinoplanes pyxinae]MCY1137264.1 Gfo/Idh/MocA family oxidoreductase [Actinoplanes pyxinae]